MKAEFVRVAPSDGNNPPRVRRLSSRPVRISGLDDLYPERPCADLRRALDRSGRQTGIVHWSGAAHLFVSDDHLHIRDLDFVLPELTCINPPHLQTKRALRPQRRSTSSNTSSFAKSSV